MGMKSRLVVAKGLELQGGVNSERSAWEKFDIMAASV